VGGADQLSRRGQSGAELVPILGARTGTESLERRERGAQLAEHDCVSGSGWIVGAVIGLGPLSTRGVTLYRFVRAGDLSSPSTAPM
jgi:hypothetical protein